MCILFSWTIFTASIGNLLKGDVFCYVCLFTGESRWDHIITSNLLTWRTPRSLPHWHLRLRTPLPALFKLVHLGKQWWPPTERPSCIILKQFLISLPFSREVNKGDNKEAVFPGLFPGGLYSVTIVTVVGTNPEVVSASSQASFRISKYFFWNLVRVLLKFL